MLELVWKSAMLGVAVLCIAVGAVPVQAKIDTSVFKIGQYGLGAGQLQFNGGGITADPATGHLFVSERQNNRISEFTAWGEFVKAWGWGVEDGSPELQSCGPVVPKLEPEVSLCRVGTAGSAPGQLGNPNGISLAPNGNLYVFERSNRRVQVFTQTGSFVRMFGGEVNKDTGADICTAADVSGGDECGEGVEGTGPSEFSRQALIRITAHSYIDTAADGTVYVGDENRIQKFDENGNFLGAINFSGTGALGALPEPGNPGALALDPVSGDIYFSYAWKFDPVNSYRLDENTGGVISSLEAVAPEAIATAPGGKVFLADDPVVSSNTQPFNNPHLLELDDSGKAVDKCCPSTSKPGESVFLLAAATNVVTAGGQVDLYVAHSGQEIGFIDVRGPAPEKFLPPPSVPPEIEVQQAISVGDLKASVQATINPNFWADTSYHLEYGLAPCSGGGCTSTAEESLGAGIVRQPVKGKPIELTGLAPNTTYHYRFVAESGGGGPVVGPDTTFTTFPEEGTQPACANDAFRGGAGKRLADCRAYEMVSPVDKLGGEILVQGNVNSMKARLDQAKPSGNAITYSSYRSFGDAESGPYSSQYLASRGATSWYSHGISPPISAPPLIGDGLDSQYQAFSEDLSSGWLLYNYSPLLAPGAVEGRPNLYRRDNSTGSFEVLSTAAPIGALEKGPEMELQAFSSDGKRTVFRAKAKLTASASADPSLFQTYEAFNGNVRLVSVKPEGAAAGFSSSAGSLGGNLPTAREGNMETAVSEDGTKIYWSEGVREGPLYVRVNTVKTVAVSAGAAKFWAAKPDGSQALYSEGGALKRFTLAGESSSTLVASGVQGVLGASEDLTRIYVVSTGALADGAQADKPNLYLYKDGQPLEFVATLAESDLGQASEPSLTTLSSIYRVAHVSEDGRVAVFMSRASLTGADNIDQVSEEADAEVFRFDADSDELACISCSPTGVAPVGRKLQILLKEGEANDYWYASRVPTWEFQLHESRVIAAGGDRVYFNSLSRLVPADVNGREDAYQWEATGTGNCTETAPGFDADVDGCVTLISSGKAEQDSEFIDASADGRDVFFLTGESLVDWDPAQFDLYDARAEGGLPAPPPVRGPECEGEGCQPPGPPAPTPTNNVTESAGPGNPKPPKTCKKGFVKKKGKCVKKHKKNNKTKHRSATRTSGGAGR